MVPQGYTLKGRHMRGVRDFSPEELWQVLWTARDIKSRLVTGEQMKILEGCTLAMIFQKPSLRTRVSFEVGMNQLGGKALYLGPEEIKIGKRETTEDIATVLSGFCDGIMARVFGHNIIEDLAKYAHVPVINALCDYEHPCQAMGDTMTIWERRGRLDGLKMVFVGDGNNVANSLAFIGARLGMHVVVASPEGFELKRDVLELAKKDVKDFNTKGSVEITNDPMKACKDADVVYTDVWASMGQEAEQEERKKKFAGFMVTEKMLDQAHHDVMLMHCLPAHYNEEIAAGLNHDRRCSFYPQAENRLHAQKGLMALIMRKR
jgi:ornithine carbamoyltransferase